MLRGTVMKTVIFTVDVEPDVMPFARGTTYGIDEAMTSLFGILAELRLPASFFFLGSTVQTHPWVAKEAASLGFEIGSHGWDHDWLCRKTPAQQFDDIDRSTEIIEQACGITPAIFRAADFSISSKALAHLADSRYVVDSSVLPERVARRFRIIPIYDHRDAPLQPYRPSRHAPSDPGHLTILEVPVAANFERPGTPIGTGYLNAFGVDKTRKAIMDYPGEFVVLLCHPWELVDLGKKLKFLPEGYGRGCSSDFRPLRRLFTELTREVRFSTLGSIAGQWNVGEGAS